MAEEATILVNADGTYADASPSALRLLGVVRDEFLTMRPGSFSPEPADPDAQLAFREAWQESGSPDIGGEATIRRGDGTKARVRFVITAQDDGRYLAMIEAAVGDIARPTTVFTLGDVLTEWRAAERRMEELEVADSEWQAVQTDIAALRDRYQSLFAAKRQSHHTVNH